MYIKTLQRAVVYLCAAFPLAPSPAKAQYEAPKQITATPTGVDLASGHFTFEAVDLAIGPFTLKRSYLGGHYIDGSETFGPNWTHNYVDFVTEGEPSKYDQTRVVLYRSQIHYTKYTTAPNPHYWNSNADSNGTTLEDVGGAFVYTDKDGTLYTFNPAVNAFSPYPSRRNQRIASIAYSDGHVLLYTYNSVGKLTQIASNRGYSLVFEYGSNGYVSKACGYNRAVTYVSSAPTCAGAALSASYSYVGNNNLTSVTDANGQTWGYDYAWSGGSTSALTCVRQVNSAACKVLNTYGGDKPASVTQQTTADGGVWTYYYDWPAKASYDDPQNAGEPPPTSAGSFNGPAGISGGSNFSGGLISNYTENGKTTTYTWNGIELESLAYTEGNKVTYSYDGHENIVSETWASKSGSGLSPISRTSVFPTPGGVIDPTCASVPRTICNKPISKTDYNGNQTDYSYDPMHGGVLNETGPAVGGTRPQRRVAYAQRYAWIKNASGSYVQAASPIWLSVAEKTCRTSATVGDACSTGSSDEIVTAFDFGPDSGPKNLLLRGKTVTAGGVTLRTCFRYDWMGNKISETAPNAGLTSCP